MPAQPVRAYAGRRLNISGSLLLTAWAGYELFVRLDDCRMWLAGVRRLAQRTDGSTLRYLIIMLEAPEMRQLADTLLFLLCALAFAVTAFALKSRPVAGLFTALLDVALFTFGCVVGMYSAIPTGLFQWLKVVPMAMVFAGCAVNFAEYLLRRRRRRRKARLR